MGADQVLSYATNLKENRRAMNLDLRFELEGLLAEYSLPEFATTLMVLTTEMQADYDPHLSVAGREALSRFCCSIARASKFAKQVEPFIAPVELSREPEVT